MHVKRGKDFVERLVWTLVEFVGGISLAEVTTGDPLSFWTPLYIGVITAAKIAAAQHFGKHDDGAAIPGGVITTPGG